MTSDVAAVALDAESIVGLASYLVGGDECEQRRRVGEHGIEIHDELEFEGAD